MGSPSELSSLGTQALESRCCGGAVGRSVLSRLTSLPPPHASIEMNTPGKDWLARPSRRRKEISIAACLPRLARDAIFPEPIPPLPTQRSSFRVPISVGGAWSSPPVWASRKYFSRSPVSKKIHPVHMYLPYLFGIKMKRAEGMCAPTAFQLKIALFCKQCNGNY